MGPPVAPTLRLPQEGLQAADTACHPVRCRLGPLSQSTGDRQPRNPHSFLPVVEAGKPETGVPARSDSEGGPCSWLCVRMQSSVVCVRRKEASSLLSLLKRALMPPRGSALLT